MSDGLAPLLLAAVAWCIPFNGIRGPSFLRELSTEAAVYPIIVFIVLSLPQSVRLLGKSVVVGFVAIITFVAIGSFLGNVEAISTFRLGEVNGLNKYFSSIAVFLLYLVFAFCLADHLSRRSMQDLIRFNNRVVLPLALFLIAVWTVEVVSWSSDTVRSVIEPVKRSISAGPFFERYRLSGVSFEPSFNAIVMIGLLPALALGALSHSNGQRVRVLFLLAAVAFVVFGAFSDSRTAYLIIWIEVALAVLLVAFARYRRLVAPVMVVILPLIVLFIAPLSLFAVVDALSDVETAPTRVSDLTRLASIKVAIELFQANPIFGIGFGQYGFHYRANVPSIAFSSWEVSSYVTGDSWASFPPSYSLYWRIGAELGLAGLASFALVVWALFARLSRLFGRTLPTEGRHLTVLCAVGLVGAVLVGVSFDSYRAPFLWIYSALAAALPLLRLAESKQDKQDSREQLTH